MQLDYLGYDLWDEPLDREIDYQGSYYHQPGLPDTLNYYYTLIPTNYQIPPDLPGTVISQVILFDENAGDEQDIEDDPWIPEPGCPDPNNPNCPCYEGPCARKVTTYAPEKPEDLVKKTTKYLMDAGVNRIELYNEMMRIAGYEDEVIETTSGGRTNKSLYTPYGTLYVRDNSSNTNIPLKNVLVKAKRFAKMRRTYTNASGYFYLDANFRKKAKLIVKFKNDKAIIRGIGTGEPDLSDVIFPLKKVLGVLERIEMENYTYVFQYNADPLSHEAMCYVAANGMNALYDTWQYCSTYQLANPPGSKSKLNIWISPYFASNNFVNSILLNDEGGLTPMLKQMLQSSVYLDIIQNLLQFFPVGDKASKAIKIFRKYPPDIAVTVQEPGTTQTRKAVSANSIFFHQYAHVIHFNQAGKDYWENYLRHLYFNLGFGTKNNIIAITESWAYFLGPTFTEKKYRLLNISIADQELKKLERQRKSNDIPRRYVDNLDIWEGWIPWGIGHDLIDTGEPSITGIADFTDGYTVSGIFKGYTTSVNSVTELRNAILANNNNRQSTQVNNLVASYGW